MTLPSGKVQALLAILALPPGRAHARDKLATLLWGGLGEAEARASLRQALFMVRRALPGLPFLVIEGDSVALNPAVVEVDLVQFERHVANGTPSAFEGAAALYQGDLLSGLAVSEPAFEEWLLTERERCRELAIEALAKLLAHQRKVSPEAAVQTALRLLALDPLQEPVHRTLMRLYVELARPAAALRQYEACVATMRRELGAEAETETKQLYREILECRPTETARRPSTMAASAQGSDPLPWVQSPARQTPLIGRDAELAQLRRTVTRLRHGQGGVVLVAGEAGIGKSRLVEELASETGKRGTVLTGHCYDMTQILAFGPWVEIMRQALAQLATRPSHATGADWHAELARLLPGIGGAGLQPAGGDHDLPRLFEAVASLLTEVAHEGGLLVVVEDLHWADEMSLRLVSFLARRLARTPAALIGIYRDEDLSDNAWTRRALVDLQRTETVTRIALEPLDQASSARLVRDLSVPSAHASDALAARVWEASGGNPLVIVEVMRALSDAPAADSGAALPRRVRDVIAARLDRLLPRDRQILAVVAVAGVEIDFALVQRAAGLDEPTAASAVEELILRRILHRRGARLVFAHDRIRDVALNVLGPLQRAPLHRTIARLIEELYRDDLATHFLALGTHYRAGNVSDRAAHYLRQAGAQALSRWANREALACFEQALAALRELPRSPETIAEEIELRFDLRRALQWLGEQRAVIDCLEEASALFGGRADPRQRGLLHTYISMAQTDILDYGPALEHAERSLEEVPAAGDLGLEIEACNNAGRLHYYLANYPRARSLLGRVVRLLEDDRASERAGEATRYLQPGRRLPAYFGRAMVMTHARFFLGFTLSMLGDIPAARACAEAMLTDAEAMAQTAAMASTLRSLLLGSLYIATGAAAPAIAALERAIAVCRANEVMGIGWFAHLGAHLAYVYARLGRTSEGSALLDETLQAVARFRWKVPRRIGLLAEACSLLGRRAEAVQIALAQLAGAGARGERGYEALLLHTLGGIALRDESPALADARSYFGQSLALAEQLGMRPLQMRAHLGLAATHRDDRDRARAEAHRRAAAALDRELGYPGFDLDLAAGTIGERA